MGYPNPDKDPLQSATAAAGAVTLNAVNALITTEALTTAGQATYTLTWTNNQIQSAEDQISVSLDNGTNSAGRPEVSTVTPSVGQAIIVIGNEHASAAFNGTLKIRAKVRRRF